MCLDTQHGEVEYLKFFQQIQLILLCLTRKCLLL